MRTRNEDDAKAGKGERKKDREREREIEKGGKFEKKSTRAHSW